MDNNILDLLIKYSNRSDITALADENQEMTYKELYEYIWHFRENQAESNILKNNRVGVIIDQSVTSTLIILILLQLNTTFLLVDNKQTKADLNRISQKTDIFIWIGAIESKNLFGDQGCTFISYQDFLSSNFSTEHLPEISLNKEKSILQITSGTTGPVKVAIISHSTLFQGSRFYSRWFNLTPQDTILTTVPFNHNFGLVGGLLSSLLSGSKLIISNKPTAKYVGKMIKKYGATVILAVPLLFELLVRSNHIAPQNLSSVRVAISSGSYLSEDISQLFLNKFQIGVSQIYGSTETGVIASTNPNIKYSSESAGEIIPGVRVKITNEGRIAVKSNTLFQGYLDNRDVLNNHGYYVTEDLGKLKDNQLFLTGRVSRFINIGGRKINPLEIKDVLTSYHGIINAKVMGTGTFQSNERIIAYVQVNNGITVEMIFRYLQIELAEYKIPHEIIIVEEIPSSWKESYKL
ncbi:class I adenylate-forming enzyme family protein [Cytobacillus oceanisediminis]|uniref:class I adenylate-forming enzyme family protein n=1 Tax=Cytobacillus oceanisediminis TaxID=665099 RepID=UPI001C215AE1|nr:fatty acid--CoA ligase family protein [Cytobacillus oceanisediminis]MBU8772088.1 fatty acid--CoA ligase family protein [Cytobacillus oceanisediminis]